MGLITPLRRICSGGRFTPAELAPKDIVVHHAPGAAGAVPAELADSGLAAPEDTECVVCLDEMENPVVTPCHHWFWWVARGWEEGAQLHVPERCNAGGGEQPQVDVCVTWSPALCTRIVCIDSALDLCCRNNGCVYPVACGGRCVLCSRTPCVEPGTSSSYLCHLRLTSQPSVLPSLTPTAVPAACPVLQPRVHHLLPAEQGHVSDAWWGGGMELCHHSLYRS
jgi:hypothetical protein